MNERPFPDRMAAPDRLDVVLRIHDPERPSELRHAVLSVICADRQPLCVNIVTQRFSAPQTDALREALVPTFALEAGVEFRFLNYAEPGPPDARSALLNFALANTKGRYLAILDYDDVIHPDGYSHLIDLFSNAKAAIALGKIAIKNKDVFDDALITTNRKFFYDGQGLADLFRENFCPIHSFVIDRQRMEPDDLYFEESLCRMEDYDFLIRSAAKYPLVFSDRVVGDYYHKNDGSNSSLISPLPNPAELAAWQKAREFVERRRRATLLSAETQRSLGLVGFEPELTVRKYLALRFGAPDIGA